MRKVFSVALMAAMVCLVGMAKDASATVTFSLIWTGTTGTGITGTNAIDAAAGDTLVLSIVMSTDQTLAAHGVSIDFDTDLGNELDLALPNGGTEWSGTTFAMGTGSYAPLTAGVIGPPAAVDSTGANAGSMRTFESGKGLTSPALPTGSYTVGTARFVVTGNGGIGDDDVFIGLFNLNVDAVLNNLNTAIPGGSLIFGTAQVNTPLIPEPGTASLLGLGLVGLVLAGRRSRR